MPLLKPLSMGVALALDLAAQSPATPPPPALLGFTLGGSATIGSQYIFRGLTQTDGKPTVQAELDLVHPSGFYLSTSFSNISWFTDQNAGVASAPTGLGSPAAVGAPLYQPGKVNSAAVELDLFGGYKWGFAKDWTLDVGLYRYLYPGTYDNLGAYRNPATTEAYLGLSYAWASLKVLAGHQREHVRRQQLRRDELRRSHPGHPSWWKWMDCAGAWRQDGLLNQGEPRLFLQRELRDG